MTTIKTPSLNLSRIFQILICVFYTWYFLPVFNALLWSGFYKVLFFACFAAGTVGLIVLNNIRINTIIVAVAGYLIIFSLLYLFRVGDANAHIRVSFTFWGTALLFFGVLKDDEKIWIGKFLLAICAVTFITSAIGVVSDNSAARTIAHAAADDTIQRAYKLKNISNVYLFQGVVFFVPFLVCCPKTRTAKLFSLILLLSIAFVLLNASFTIALLVFIFTLILSILLKESNSSRIVVIMVLSFIALIMFINGYDLLTSIAEQIDNDYISARIYEIRGLLFSGQLTGDAKIRWDVYETSLKTFGRNLLGVGVHYSYLKFENGIGYHSQLLDDLARYGIFALLFYVVFFVGYYMHMKKALKRIGHPKIAIAVTIIYIVFLILNLGFRSADESIITLFIVPVLPLLIETHIKNKHNKIRE